MLEVLPLKHFPTFLEQIDLMYYFQRSFENDITGLASSTLFFWGVLLDAIDKKIIEKNPLDSRPPSDQSSM